MSPRRHRRRLHIVGIFDFHCVCLCFVWFMSNKMLFVTLMCKLSELEMQLAATEYGVYFRIH